MTAQTLAQTTSGFSSVRPDFQLPTTSASDDWPTDCGVVGMGKAQATGPDRLVVMVGLIAYEQNSRAV
ncbi:MAG: hypothetical protein O9253_02125 [Aquidulcibacter sp.]|nr:hypothetical protein [Aquidulcibacter sp.]